jgi:TonB family protein
MMTNLLLAVVLAATTLPSQSMYRWIPARIQNMSYPILGLQAQISGTVVLRIKINSTGTVTEVRVLSGHSLLAKAARENIGSWRFIEILGGRPPSETEMEFRYLFKLESEAIASPPTDFVYEYPNRVTVTSKPLHWMP